MLRHSRNDQYHSLKSSIIGLNDHRLDAVVFKSVFHACHKGSPKKTDRFFLKTRTARFDSFGVSREIFYEGNAENEAFVVKEGAVVNDGCVVNEGAVENELVFMNVEMVDVVSYELFGIPAFGDASPGEACTFAFMSPAGIEAEKVPVAVSMLRALAAWTSFGGLSGPPGPPPHAASRPNRLGVIMNRILRSKTGIKGMNLVHRYLCT